jgi:hypothetical protein
MDFILTLASLLPFTPSAEAVEDSEWSDIPRDFGQSKNNNYCVVA